MNKRILTIALLTLAMVISMLALTACTPAEENPGTDASSTPGNEEVTQYTITYAGGEGAVGEAPAATAAKSGTSVILASNTFTKEGYVFAGWTDGTTVFNAGDLFVIGEADVTLTAVWEVAPEIVNEITSVVYSNMSITVSGTIDSAAAKLCVGTDGLHNFYQDVTVGENGSFTATFDLNTLKADDGWYNVAIIGTDAEGNEIKVLADISKLTGAAQDNVLEGTYITAKIVSWDGDNGFKSLSFEVDHKDILVGGKVSTSNVPFGLVEEDGKVYLTFNGEIAADASAKTIELVLTYADPSDNPSSLDESQIVLTAQNIYAGDNANAFSFKANLTDSVANRGAWVRFVLKVTEGDVVTYYTVKPYVESHNGDWHALADAITLGDAKYEMAICWSSVFVQVVNP